MIPFDILAPRNVCRYTIYHGCEAYHFDSILYIAVVYVIHPHLINHIQDLACVQSFAPQVYANLVRTEPTLVEVPMRQTRTTNYNVLQEGEQCD